MKLRPHSVAWNGEHLDKDEFAFVQISHAPQPTNIVFYCRGNRERPCICQIPIKLGEPDPGKLIFGWDGNRESPTISPSIDCSARCGWHGHIVAGDIIDS